MLTGVDYRTSQNKTMENQPNQTSRRVVRQVALNQPPIKITPEGGYHRDWNVTKKSHILFFQSLVEKNQIRKDLADQNVKSIVEAWEAQESVPQIKDSKWVVARQLSAFSKSINNPLSADSFVKRYQFWSHLHVQ